VSALEASINDAGTGLLARATALETFKTYVEDQSGAGFLANASYLTALQAQVDDNSASLVTSGEVSAAIDGELSGRYFVKLDINGRISGLELYDNGAEADFIIQADTFQIRTTDGTQVFSINGTSASLDVDAINLNGLIPNANIGSITADKITITGLGGVSSIADVIIDTGEITNAMIGNTIQSNSLNLGAGTGWKIDKTGNIDAASLRLRNSSGDIVFDASGMDGTHIDNLSVDTLKLANEAVTTPRFSTSVGGSPGTGWTNIFSYAVSLGSNYPAAVMCVGFGYFEADPGAEASIALQLRDSNGAAGGDVAMSVASGYSGSLTCTAMFYPTSSSQTYYLYAKASSGTFTMSNKGISVMGVKK
jgi:hypothetical protein